MRFVFLMIYMAIIVCCIVAAGMMARAVEPRDIPIENEFLRNQRDNEAHAKSEFMLELAIRTKQLADALWQIGELKAAADTAKKACEKPAESH